MSAAVARRYAKALFALAKEQGALVETAEQTHRIAAAVLDPGVGPVVRSPLLAPARRREVMQMLARDARASDLLTRFVGVLAEHQRVGELPAIADHFQRLLDDELGRVRVTLRSARPLGATHAQRIVATFATLTGKQVVPTTVVDAELLGGVVVEVQGKVYDGCVRTQLERLAKELTGSASA